MSAIGHGVETCRLTSVYINDRLIEKRGSMGKFANDLDACCKAYVRCKARVCSLSWSKLCLKRALKVFANEVHHRGVDCRSDQFYILEYNDKPQDLN